MRREGEAAALAAERRVADLVSSAHRLRTRLLEKKHSEFVARQRRHGSHALCEGERAEYV